MAESDLHVTLTLEDLENIDSFPKRTITLRAPEWRIKVGRGTYSGTENLTPTPENTWFESRVMSRDHAVLKAVPETRDIIITDSGSMHGTFVSGRKLAKGEECILVSDDKITFGADVTRGANCFTSVKLNMITKWSDNNNFGLSTIHPPLKSHNSFSADYTSDEEIVEIESESNISDDSEDEGSIQEVQSQRQTFSVPDSDVSDYPSYISDGGMLEEDSPESSLIADDAALAHPTSDAEIKNSGNYRASSPDLWVYGPQDSTANGLEKEQPSAQIPGENDYWTVAPGPFPNDSFEETGAELAETRSDNGDFLPAPPFPQRQNRSARAPSPSDAAMARPPVPNPVPWRNEAHTSLSVSAQPMTLPATYNGTGYGHAWAGHNSVLYDPVPTHPSYEQLEITYDKPYAFTSTPVYASPTSTGTLKHLSSASKPVQCNTMSISTQGHLKTDTPLAQPNGKKCSVRGTKAGLKRTINDLEDNDAVEPLTVVNELSGVDSLRVPLAKLEKDSAPQLRTTTVSAEPPQKKVKTSTSTESKAKSTFMKYAATALVSAAVGAVGTVMGLAALPPDYFV